MNETIAADTWLYQTLTGDSVIAGILGSHVYEAMADQDAPYPHIVYQVQSPGNDLIVIGTARILTKPLYLVRVIEAANGYSDDAVAVTDRIDALLHGAYATLDDVSISVTRISPFRMTETTSGMQVKHLGGLYRFHISPN